MNIVLLQYTCTLKSLDISYY